MENENTIQKINALAKMDWHEERVMTTAQLAEFYETSLSCIKMNFHRNREHFIEGKHFFKIAGDELKGFLGNLVTDGYIDCDEDAAPVTEMGAPCDEVSPAKFSPQEKLDALLKCAAATDNPKLRDSIVRKAVKFILS